MVNSSTFISLLLIQISCITLGSSFYLNASFLPFVMRLTTFFSRRGKCRTLRDNRCVEAPSHRFFVNFNRDGDLASSYLPVEEDHLGVVI